MTKLTNVPVWANGTFIWRLNLADTRNALGEARQAIAAVANSLDHAVNQIIFLSGVIGADEGRLAWDGIWPYWQRLTYRINGWEELSRFMIDMRDQHRASISFHVNLTDVNAGLRLYPETREFFERLRAEKAIFRRPQGFNAQPWFGLPYVPEKIPDGDASDIFAMVNYQRFWESGMAREQIDGLLDRLPYMPPLMYVDVLGPVGWCIHPGYPDANLGGSRASQLAGVQQIVRYFRHRGCEVGGESFDRLTEHTDPPIRYCWCHGGLSTNDYSQIGSGYAMGATAARGGKVMQVYGNQGGYHIQLGTGLPDSIQSTVEQPLFENSGWHDPLSSAEEDGICTWGTAQDMVRQFHLTVAPELYHIGCDAFRLPGGSNWKLLDEAEGRAQIDALTLRDSAGTVRMIEAETAALLGSCRIAEDKWASGGKTVTDVGMSLGNGVAFAVELDGAGPWEIFLRYSSVGGGVMSLQLDDQPPQRLELADTAGWNAYGDHLLPLKLTAGAHVIRLRRDRVFAEWSDGARAEWSITGGFQAQHGPVTLGVDGDRFCPDTWSGEQRILLYSRTGGRRTWTLPESWAGIAKVRLVPLTEQGRDMTRALTLPVSDRRCTVPLNSNESAVLLLG